MEVNLPNKTNKLFQEDKTYNNEAWLKNPANKFFLYSEGYKNTGQQLYESITQNTFYKNSLIYPLVFVYRQFLELRLKELIVLGYKFIDTSKDFPDEHNLFILWGIYRNDILKNIEPIDKNILENVERLIKEFNDLDPKSMNFRYPVTRGPNRKESLLNESIDITNFKSVIDKLIYFFDWQWEMLNHYQDLKNEMVADAYSNYWY